MVNKVSRRAVVSAAAALPLLAQTAPPATPEPTTSEERLKAARDQNRRTAETLTKFLIDMSLEPAFQFRP